MGCTGMEDMGGDTLVSHYGAHGDGGYGQRYARESLWGARGWRIWAEITWNWELRVLV